MLEVHKALNLCLNGQTVNKEHRALEHSLLQPSNSHQSAIET